MFRHYLSLGLCATLLALLTACAPPSFPSDGDCPTAVGTTSAPDVTVGVDSDRQALIDEMRAQLLDLKRQQYEDKAAYEAHIAALEAEIKALEDQLEQAQSPTPDTDRPVSTRPPPPPHEETSSSEAVFGYIVENGTITILSYLGNDSTVSVPAYVDRYPVTAIADDAFRGTDVISVVLPDTVTSIGWFAFANCRSLTAVTLPASVESIGYGAFDGCSLLTLYCPTDSYAARYAHSFAIPHTEN